MKNLRVLCAAFVLTGALAAPALGGEIGTGSPTPPPSQPATASGDIGTGATDGEIGTGFTPDATKTATDLTAAEAALSLLQGAFSLI
jgi:hypothetical protein